MSSKNIFERSQNNFDLIRLIAAYMVIWTHSYFIAPKDGSTELISRLTSVTYAGEIAVFIFFFFSGAFIFKSMASSKSEVDFIIKRFFRIFPPLVACVLFAVAVGMALTTLSIADYLQDQQVHRYISNNLKLIWNEHFLPGVFQDHPDKGLNGSLWSITLEARLYLVVFIVGLFGVFRERLSASLAIVLMLVWLLTSPDTVPLLGSSMQLLGQGVFPKYAITFLAGGLVFHNSAHFKIKAPAVAALLVALVLTKDTVLFKAAIMIFSIALAYYFGTSAVAMKVRLPADYPMGSTCMVGHHHN